jgi:hypothetical protein
VRGSIKAEVRFVHVTLRADESRVDELRAFYGGALGLDSAGGCSFHVGATALEFSPVAHAEPFYHFALRVPRNRFDSARTWLGERAELLPDEETGDTRFDFRFWNAEACYVHDPCGNIVELIAHHELPEETPDDGPFAGSELLGLCELGAAGDDVPAMARALGRLGIELWDGTIEVPGRLAFMGGRDGVLILAPLGRGWLPTGRPSEQWPVDAVVAGERDGEVVLPGTGHRVRTVVSA